jgi:hypothetical protein
MITINKQINQPVPSLPSPCQNFGTEKLASGPRRMRREKERRRISALTTNLAFILLLFHPHSPKLFLPLPLSLSLPLPIIIMIII